MGPPAAITAASAAAVDQALEVRPTASELLRFRDYVQRHSGIFLEAERAESLRDSLIARATQLGCASFENYYRLLKTDEAEFKELLNLVTINETSFFRFPAQFDVFANSVIPEVLATKPGASGVLRVWSAGCSSGEEPYSIAIKLLEAEVASRGFQPQVVGTDISTVALDIARTGVYPLRAFAGLAAETRDRYFEQVPEGYRVVEAVRDSVELSYHNLVKEPYPIQLTGNWDVIFCRNVTIYFRLESTRRVLHRFFESLNPGGYLFIGHSETLAAVSDEFEPVEIDGVFLYRKPQARRIFGLERPEAARTGRKAPPATPSSAAAKAPAGQARKGEDGDARPSGESPMETHLRTAHAHADAGDFTSAIAACRRALNENPLSSAARYILGVIYQRLDEPNRAIHEFQRAVCVNPDFVLAYFNLATIYRGRRALAEACAEYANTLAALQRSPDGDWTVFLDGFTPALLAQSCERALSECKKVPSDG
jgi:chemotaxis protein methyltransferase CheR